MEKSWKRGALLIVVSGPSGSGKTSLCRALRQQGKMHYSISCTTRPPRQGEKNGVDYHFLDPEDFQQRATRGEFLEYAQVHGHFYGTLQTEVTQPLEHGVDVLMDIDTHGAALIRQNQHPLIQRSLVDIFIMPPDLAELRKRLTSRGTEDFDQIEKRLHNAQQEMMHWQAYQYVMLSGSREEDFHHFSSILIGERQRSRHLFAVADSATAPATDLHQIDFLADKP